MVTAIVLVTCEVDQTLETAQVLADPEGLRGLPGGRHWDLVAVVRVGDHDDLAATVTEHIRKVQGVASTWHPDRLPHPLPPRPRPDVLGRLRGRPAGLTFAGQFRGRLAAGRCASVQRSGPPRRPGGCGGDGNDDASARSWRCWWRPWWPSPPPRPPRPGPAVAVRRRRGQVDRRPAPSWSAHLPLGARPQRVRRQHHRPHRLPRRRNGFGALAVEVCDGTTQTWQAEVTTFGEPAFTAGSASALASGLAPPGTPPART